MGPGQERPSHLGGGGLQRGLGAEPQSTGCQGRIQKPGWGEPWCEVGRLPAGGILRGPLLCLLPRASSSAHLASLKPSKPSGWHWPGAHRHSREAPGATGSGEKPASVRGARPALPRSPAPAPPRCPASRASPRSPASRAPPAPHLRTHLPGASWSPSTTPEVTLLHCSTGDPGLPGASRSYNTGGHSQPHPGPEYPDTLSGLRAGHPRTPTLASTGSQAGLPEAPSLGTRTEQRGASRAPSSQGGRPLGTPGSGGSG